MSAISENFIRSPLFYVGDKYKILPQILNYFPKTIDKFIEPFCGGGSVFLNTNAKQFCINDINNAVIQLHKFLTQTSNDNSFWKNIEKTISLYGLSATYKGFQIPEELKSSFPKTYFAHYNKKSYLTMRNDYNKEKENSLLLYLLVIYGFNRMLRFNAKGDFNVPVGNVDFNNNVVTALSDYFNNISNKKITYDSKDFEIFIENISPTQNDFVYLDPPYLITASEYNKIWNEKNEKRLLSLLDELNKNNIKFAVSNVIKYKDKQNVIFYNWAQKYNIEYIKSNYINWFDNSNKKPLEVLIKNF